MPRSRKSRAIPLLTLWAFVACYGENLYLYLSCWTVYIHGPYKIKWSARITEIITESTRKRKLGQWPVKLKENQVVKLFRIIRIHLRISHISFFFINKRILHGLFQWNDFTWQVLLNTCCCLPDSDKISAKVKQVWRKIIPRSQMYYRPPSIFALKTSKLMLLISAFPSHSFVIYFPDIERNLRDVTQWLPVSLSLSVVLYFSPKKNIYWTSPGINCCWI